MTEEISFWQLLRGRSFVIVAGLALGIPALHLLFPSAEYTNPFIFITAPAFVILYFSWNPAWSGGEFRFRRIPCLIFLTVTTVLTALWFAVGWEDGMVVQGRRYTYFVAIINGLYLMFLWVGLIAQFRRKVDVSFGGLQHWILFAWLAWFAFPFMGEIT